LTAQADQNKAQKEKIAAKFKDIEKIRDANKALEKEL